MKTPIAIIILGVVLVGLGFLVLKNPPENASQGQNIELTQLKDFTFRIEDKKLVEGPATITVQKGDEIVLIVTNDTAEEFHLHGYDKSVDLEPGVEAQLRLVADTAGRFPIELEGSKTDIAVLEVLP